MTQPDFSLEDKATGLICGIDEAGRGPLAGPVVAAAVIWRRELTPARLLDAINDSKKLSPQKRADLFDAIKDHAHVGIGLCHADEIDDINILQATLRAMEKAVADLSIPPDFTLVDGNKAPKLPCPVQTVISGDAKSLSIAAASIIAKHHRDILMQEYARKYPHYGWERNAGYGTAAHLRAMDEHGITPLHRMSFSPVAARAAKKAQKAA
ncbi:MAG: ribonuclease HII [Alphaproteobacteria bacterium]|nr:ribonuclease HII [Alphaproteobacteria bacterium]